MARTPSRTTREGKTMPSGTKRVKHRGGNADSTPVKPTKSFISSSTKASEKRPTLSTHQKTNVTKDVDTEEETEDVVYTLKHTTLKEQTTVVRVEYAPIETEEVSEEDAARTSAGIFAPAFGLGKIVVDTITAVHHGIRKYASGTLTPPAAPSVEGESSPPRAVHDALHPDSDQENEAVVEEKEWDEVVEEEEEIFDEDPWFWIAHTQPFFTARKKQHQEQFLHFALPCKLRSSPPITLVLDLDETLVHCSTNGLSIDPDVTFDVDFGGKVYKVSGCLRPHVKEFLATVSETFEVIVFTASMQVYADRILDILDPQHKYIKYRLFREHCLEIDGNYIKDLEILGRDLSKTIIVDNAPQAFAFQPSNGIPSVTWTEDKDDNGLMEIADFLKSIKDVDDVRPHVNRKWRTAEKLNSISKKYGLPLAA